MREPLPPFTESSTARPGRLTSEAAGWGGLDWDPARESKIQSLNPKLQCSYQNKRGAETARAKECTYTYLGFATNLFVLCPTNYIRTAFAYRFSAEERILRSVAKLV